MDKKIISKKLARKNPSTELVSSLPSELQINDASSNEIKAICKKIGMSLENYLLAIQRGLSARKITVDKYGEEHVEDDTMAQLKAALIGLEVEGYIKTKGATTDNSKHTHVTYAWLTGNATSGRVLNVDDKGSNN